MAGWLAGWLGGCCVGLGCVGCVLVVFWLCFGCVLVVFLVVVVVGCVCCGWLCLLSWTRVNEVTTCFVRTTLRTYWHQLPKNSTESSESTSKWTGVRKHSENTVNPAADRHMKNSLTSCATSDLRIRAHLHVEMREILPKATVN